MIVSSCNTELQLNKENTISAINLKTSTIYQPKTEDSFITGDYGVYMDYFKETDNLIGLSSSKTGNDNRIFGYIGPYQTIRTKGEQDLDFNVFVNGIEFSKNATTKSAPSDLRSLFGSNAQFTINQRSETRSNNDETIVELYIPKEIEITVPFVGSDKMLPLCYYDGLHLKWNEDFNNSNGVIVILEWIGELLAGNDVPSTHIRRTMIAGDTGSIVIPNDLFEEIPDTAVCHLTLIRGNIETLSIDGISYKIQAESHDFLTFVLIKEIKHV